MATNETFKRQDTLIQSAQIIEDGVTAIHKFLFGALPPTDKPSETSPHPMVNAETPYFEAMILKQIELDHIQSRTHTILKQLMDRLEMKKVNGSASVGQRAIPRAGVSERLDQAFESLDRELRT